MDNSFFAYLQLLELVAFFSGYSLVYALVILITKKVPLKSIFNKPAAKLLPFSYALVGSLYLGLQLKNLYPYYTFNHVIGSLQRPYLILWGVLSVLFWIPAVARIKMLSLLHSLVFVFFPARDIAALLSAAPTDSNIISNDIKLYTTSILLNSAAFIVITLSSSFYMMYKKRSAS